jgi:hypothetical protein
MGYHVFYNGRIDITPPLTVDDARIFQTIINPERQDKNIFNTDTSAETIRQAIEDENDYLSSFPLDLKDDRATLEDTGNEERNGCAEWLTSLIQHFFAPRGYVLDGDITWAGDNIDDRGAIYIKANQLEAVDDVIDNPGPSWERNPAADAAELVYSMNSQAEYHDGLVTFPAYLLEQLHNALNPDDQRHEYTKSEATNA